MYENFIKNNNLWHKIGLNSLFKLSAKLQHIQNFYFQTLAPNTKWNARRVGDFRTSGNQHHII